MATRKTSKGRRFWWR